MSKTNDSGINRPVIVAVAQGLLILFSLTILFMLSISLMVFILNSRNGISSASLVLLHSAMAGLVLLSLIAFRGLTKRRIYGKWLAVLSMTLFWCLLIPTTLRLPEGSYNFYDQKFWSFIGEIVVLVTLHGGLLFLILNLAFSKKVQRYFRQDTPIQAQN